MMQIVDVLQKERERGKNIFSVPATKFIRTEASIGQSPMDDYLWLLSFELEIFTE